MQTSTSLEYEPSSEPLLIIVKQLFLNRELYHQVILWAFTAAASFYVWVKWGKHFGVSEDPYGEEKAPLLRKAEDTLV